MTKFIALAAAALLAAAPAHAGIFYAKGAAAIIAAPAICSIVLANGAVLRAQ